MYVDPNKPLPPADTKEDYLGSVLNAIINISNKRTEAQGTPEEFKETIEQQQDMADAKLDAFSKFADDALSAHSGKKGAIHGETKGTVGLDLKDNWRMGTVAEHEAGTAKNVFCHPYGTKKLVEARLVIDPKRYIRARKIPIASGGQLGNVPQWPFSWEEGEVTQSHNDPMDYYCETPWQFATDNGLFIIPAMNGSDVLTQAVADSGRPKRATTPFGGTNIRVYNTVLDIRRTRPSLLRGESNNEPNNDLIKGSGHLFDRHAAFYCETDHIGVRAFNKGRLPFDVLKNNDITKKNWSGIIESRENMIYNINTYVTNGNIGGWGDDIYFIIEMGLWSFNASGLDTKNGIGRAAETIATLGTKIETLNFTVPASGKFRILKRAGMLDAIAVKLSDILTYPANQKDTLYKLFNTSLSSRVAFAWRNRLKGELALRIPIGFYSKDKMYYTNYYLDVSALIKENLTTKVATVDFNTLRDVSANIQTLNANLQVSTAGRFVQYNWNVQGDVFHPLVFNGVFEAQGGHVKTYTLYNRQYVGYYQHNVDSVKTWIGNGDDIKPIMTKYNYSSMSNINNDGFYGDHLRHVPISVNEDETTDYLVYSRDWRNEYRWSVANVKTDTAPEMLTPTGHHIGPWRNRIDWIKPAMSTVPSFLIQNEEGSPQFNVNGLVFNTQNNFKGFGRVAVDADNVADPVQILDPVNIDDTILNWVALNGGGWLKSNKQFFYFKNRVMWISQTTDANEMKSDGVDGYYGWINNCYLDVQGDVRTVKVNGNVGDSAIAKPIKINLKKSLQVLSRDVTGWDQFDSSDTFLMLMNQSGNVSSYLVMLNLAPFNNFYFEFMLEINTDTGTTSFGPMTSGSPDPIFTYDPANGYQVDYDQVTGYGTKTPHRFHVNFQTPVMLKKSMWSFRKTPGHYGICSQSIGFIVADGGLMNSVEGTPIYPVGSVVTVGGSNIITKSPISAAQAFFGGDEELLVRQFGNNQDGTTSADGLTLYGVKNNLGYETEPGSGITPCGFLRNNKFYHYDPNGWRHALLPVIDGKRMSFYGYGSSFPAFMGVNGSGVPVNRFFLQEQPTIVQWATSEGREIYIGSGSNVTITISGELQPYAGGGTYTIPAKYTGAVDIAVTGLLTLKWMPGFGTLKQIGNTVTKLDFSGSKQFTILASLPSRITSLRGTFKNATGAAYPNIETWDTRNVTDMAECFMGATNFNHNVINWNTSSVTTMESMFEGATAFNQAIGRWNVSRVTNMGKMFKGANGFNQDLSGWNITVCSVFSEMFMNATRFNGNISTWNVQTCYDFTGMFENASAFNNDISRWVMTGATRFSRMFKNAVLFNAAINSWDVSSAIYMDEMFSGALAFNRTLANWNTSKVTTTREMFYKTSNFGKDGGFGLSNWNMSVNNDLTRMFAQSGFNGPLNDWSFGQDAILTEMFASSLLFNQDISSWDVGNVKAMDNMFNAAKAFVSDITGWILSNCTTFAYMFANTGFRGAVSGWRFSNSVGISMIGMFSSCSFFAGNGVEDWNTGKVYTFAGMFNGATIFNGDVSGWDVGEASSFRNMFRKTDLFNCDLSSWDMSMAVDISDMFNEAKSFNGDVSTWNVSNVQLMHGMFVAAVQFNQDISRWDTSSVVKITAMFQQAAAFNQDLSKWDTSNITNFDGMFWNATSFNSDISTWNTAKSITFSNMFRGAILFNSDISNWNVSNVVDMSAMFNDASAFNQDVSAWDVSKVTNMNYMFQRATLFNQDLSGWNVAKVTTHTDFALGADGWTLPQPNFPS